MFVDASALVAILTRESEADALADLLEGTDGAVTSAIAVFEAVAGVCRKRQVSVAEARAAVLDLLEAAGVRIVPITAADGDAAVDAFARFGKGRGHPAQLNMGDCFAYAVARGRGVAVLCKGDDFRGTDVGVVG